MELKEGDTRLLYPGWEWPEKQPQKISVTVVEILQTRQVRVKLPNGAEKVTDSRWLCDENGCSAGEEENRRISQECERMLKQPVLGQPALGNSALHTSHRMKHFCPKCHGGGVVFNRTLLFPVFWPLIPLSLLFGDLHEDCCPRCGGNGLVYI